MKVDSIITDRLIIRDVTENDTKDIWEIWANSENEKYMSDPVKSMMRLSLYVKKEKMILIMGS